MMEFITSRTALITCGVILMATVAAPIADMYTEKSSGSYDDLAEHDAAVIDALWKSELDDIVLSGDVLLPSAEFGLTLEGYFITVTDGDGNSHTASVSHCFERTVIGYGDEVTIHRGCEDATSGNGSAARASIIVSCE